MMKGIAQDFVRYVMHVQVIHEQAPVAAPAVLTTQESGPAEPGTDPTGVDTTPLAASGGAPTAPTAPAAPAPAAPVPAAPVPTAAAPAPTVGRETAPEVRNLQTSSSSDVTGSAFARVAAGDAPVEPAARQGRPAKQETVVKDEWSKTPRNAPCPCGSGKKFKLCHGAS